MFYFTFRADINKMNKRGKTPLQILIENHRQSPQRISGKPGAARNQERFSKNTDSFGLIFWKLEKGISTRIQTA